MFFFINSQVSPDVDNKNGGRLLINDQNKYRSMVTRVYSSIWMIGGFVLAIYMGHLCIWAMVVVIQIFMARELFNLLRKAHEDRHLPGFRLLNWYVKIDIVNLSTPNGSLVFVWESYSQRKLISWRNDN